MAASDGSSARFDGKPRCQRSDGWWGVISTIPAKQSRAYRSVNVSINSVKSNIVIRVESERVFTSSRHTCSIVSEGPRGPGRSVSTGKEQKVVQWIYDGVVVGGPVCCSSSS